MNSSNENNEFQGKMKMFYKISEQTENASPQLKSSRQTTAKPIMQNAQKQQSLLQKSNNPNFKPVKMLKNIRMFIDLQNQYMPSKKPKKWGNCKNQSDYEANSDKQYVNFEDNTSQSNQYSSNVYQQSYFTLQQQISMKVQSCFDFDSNMELAQMQIDIAHNIIDLKKYLDKMEILEESVDKLILSMKIKKQQMNHHK